MFEQAYAVSVRHLSQEATDRAEAEEQAQAQQGKVIRHSRPLVARWDHDLTTFTPGELGTP